MLLKFKIPILFFILFLSFSKAPALEKGYSSVMLPCLDGRKRALGIYSPPAYSQKKPLPLFIWLHGGVNRVEKNRGAEAVSFFAKEAKKGGIICAAPSGERGATWFDEVGYDHIQKSIEYVLTHYKIDSTRIFIGGSSDGATACYLLAMKMSFPKVKGFVICSGFPGILPQLGVPFDLRICSKYSWYIIHTGKDRLYPLLQVEEYVNKMKLTGTSVVFKEYPDLPHGLDYADKERPLILEWMMK
jgi:acetyl esterase/lipase